MPNLGCRGAESPGWFDVSTKNSTRDVRRDWVCCCDEAANHQFALSCSLLNHLNSFCAGIFKLNAKFDADLSLYLLSHFEWDGHTVLIHTQQHAPPPLTTSTVKLSLFTHVHSSPLSLAAQLHCYINNGWTFSRQPSYLDRQWYKSNYGLSFLHKTRDWFRDMHLMHWEAWAISDLQ